MIGICVDSNAQLPPSVAERFGFEVVPLTVTVDDHDYLEGIDLDADDFYSKFSDDHTPVVQTAAPSPGRFAAAYDRLASRGATAILSVHIGSALSGTINAARVAARNSPVPVRFVDTEAASFVVGFAALEAADALANDAGLEGAATAAEEVSRKCGNVFVVGTLAFARAGGRLAGGAHESVGLPVLSLQHGQMESIGTANGVDVAASMMAESALATGTLLRVGIGCSDPSSFAVGDALARALDGHSHVGEILRYRIGPSVGAHTGPGTAGAVFYATE